MSPKNVIPPEEPEKVPNPDPGGGQGDAHDHDREAVTSRSRLLRLRGRPPRPRTAEKRAVVAMQAHLRCEDLLSGKAAPPGWIAGPSRA